MGRGLVEDLGASGQPAKPPRARGAMNFFAWDPAPGGWHQFPGRHAAVTHLMARSQGVGVITYPPFMPLWGM